MMSNMTPQYTTILLTQVWDNAADFLDDYANVGIPTTITTQSATTLFYLLYARYGNNPIANRDIEQFKYKIFSVVFQYGPTWEKKLSIQETLRGLSEDEIMRGSKAIYNTALNPSQAPTTSTTDELDYINSQNTTNNKRSKLDAYQQLWGLLSTDVTEDLLNKFKKCFKLFVSPEHRLLYVTEIEEEEGD